MQSYKVQSNMRKWEIRDYGNGIFEIIIALWVWTVKPHYIDALTKLGKEHIILDVRQMGIFQTHYVVTTMPKT